VIFAPAIAQGGTGVFRCDGEGARSGNGVLTIQLPKNLTLSRWPCRPGGTQTAWLNVFA